MHTPARSAAAHRRVLRICRLIVLARALAAVLIGLALVAPPAYAHAHLTKSSPAADATLTAPPTEMRLWFSEALEVSLTRVTLRGPDGETVPLGAVVADSGSRLAVAVAVRGSLPPGRYIVEWRAMAADGHLSQGTFAFTMSGARIGAPANASPSAGTPQAAVGRHEPPATSPRREVSPAAPGTVRKGELGTGGETNAFDVGSPLYVAVRWVLYLGLVALTGTVAFYWLVLGRMPKEFAEIRGVPSCARAATLGAAASGLVLVAVIGRLLAQAAVMQTMMHDASSPPTIARPFGANVSMVLSTSWAQSWWLQAGTAVGALGAFLVARSAALRVTAGASPRTSPLLRASWIVATLAVVTLALTPALSGHAAAVPKWTGLAIIADVAHVLGAGGWLGTLLAVLIVGIPIAVTLPNGQRGSAVAALVNTFSPVALVSAGVLTLSGLYAGVVHVGTLSAVLGTAYGRTLLIKLGVLTPVALTGFYNWRVVRPTLGADRGTERVRRSAGVELSVGVLVLAVTAILVATPTPDEPSSPASTAVRTTNSPP